MDNQNNKPNSEPINSNLITGMTSNTNPNSQYQSPSISPIQQTPQSQAFIPNSSQIGQLPPYNLYTNQNQQLNCVRYHKQQP